MTQSVIDAPRLEYHQPLPSVERRHRIRNTIQTLLVALPGADKQSRQLHKDIQSGKSRCADHVSLMVDSAIARKEESRVRAIAHALLAFCNAGVLKVRRAYSAIYRTETREQGQLDNVELAVEQGDRSAPTLHALIRELGDSIAVMTEMQEWAMNELYVHHGERP